MLILNHTNLIKKLGMIALMGLITSGAFADVYKVTDAEGNVTYTDRPQHYVNDSNVTVEPITIYTRQSSDSSSSTGQTTRSTNTNTASVSNQTVPRSSNTSENSSRNINYQLTIEEPAQEQAYRKPAQEIQVSVNVSPELRHSDQVVITIDDEQYATGSNVTIPSSDLLPGEHTLTVEIVNGDGEVLESQSMPFYIIQNTNALQQRQQLLKQLQAYQNLPWYQRLYLQLRRKESVEKPNVNADGQVSNGITTVQPSVSNSLSGVRSQGGVRSSF